MLVLALCLGLCGCAQGAVDMETFLRAANEVVEAVQNENDGIGNIEADLNATLNSIRDGDSANSGYHLSSGAFRQRTEIAQKIADSVTYDIIKTERKGNEAKATVSFSFPDGITIMEMSSSSSENIEELLKQFKVELAKKKYVLKKDITLELVCVENHWYLAPNLEMDNVFSGGLLEQYAKTNLNNFNKLLEDAQ